MPYEPLEDCTKSSIGHDMELLEMTPENIRMDEDAVTVMLRVKCRNCGVVAWERFESVDWVKETE